MDGTLNEKEKKWIKAMTKKRIKLSKWRRKWRTRIKGEKRKKRKNKTGKDKK